MTCFIIFTGSQHVLHAIRRVNDHCSFDAPCVLWKEACVLHRLACPVFRCLQRTKKCGGAKSPGRKGQGAPSHAGCGSDGAVVMGLDEAGAVLEGLGARCSMYGIQVLEGCYRTTGAGVSAAGASLQQWWDVQLTSVY